MKSLLFSLLCCLTGSPPTLFAAAVAAAAEEETCGGTFRGFQYTITSPNYPGNYPSRAECIYRLEAEPPTAAGKCEQQFDLQFLDFNVRASDEACSKGDYLQVGDSHLYCGNAVGLRKFTAGASNTLIVRFHSDEKGTAKGFKILVSALPCSLKLSRSSTADPPRHKGIKAVDGRSSSKAYDASSTSESRPARVVSSYLFLPAKETDANVTLHYDLGPAASAISDENSFSVPPPSSDLLPPSVNAISTFDALQTVPVKKAGGSPLLDYEQQMGSDCDRNRQFSDPIQPAPGYGSSPNLVYDPRYGFPGSSNYPAAAAAAPPGLSAGSAEGYYYDYPAAGIGSPYYDPTNVAYNPSDGGVGGYPAAAAGIGFGGASALAVGPAGFECCRMQQPWTSSRFSIVSPGFPGGGIAASNSQYSCGYTIVKSSPDVCRLKLNFRFFNFGADTDPYCSLAYLQVDGQRFCGCRTGQRLQLLFDDYNIVKTISIFSAGYLRSNKLTGFLIDVIQERCAALQSSSSYPLYNPITYPAYAYRRSSVNASAHSAVDSKPLRGRNKRDLAYSYPTPIQAPFATLPQAQTHDRFLAGNCQSRLLFDWAIASKEAFLKHARCAPAGYGFGARRLTRSHSAGAADDQDVALESSDCEDISENQGEIKSPNYPNAYPAHLYKCYRFNKAPNFCQLEIHVRDFDLESSQDCAKDYLSFSVEQKKYCGRSLNDFRTVFDLTHTSSLQVDFASDDRGTGRGFDIGFSRLPCEPPDTF